MTLLGLYIIYIDIVRNRLKNHCTTLVELSSCTM